MPSLAETYALSTGMHLDKPYIRKQFYPLDFEKYITIQPFSSNQASKNYDYWAEVTQILAPILDQNEIKIIQLGAKDEPPLVGCVHLMGKTSMAQSNYILNSTILHIGADSVCQHIAGALDRPILVIHGATTARNHGAFWKQNYIFIEAHRSDKNPSFGPEQEKTINTIPPEDIVNGALKLLGSNIALNRKSLFMGARYGQNILEYVPDAPLDPNFAKDSPISARFDLGGDENILFQTLQGRKLHILTKTPINPNGLAQLKANIETLTIEFTHNSPITTDYIRILKSIGLKLQCFTLELDGDELSRKRLEFFDYCQIIKVNHKTRVDFVEGLKKYQNIKGDFIYQVNPNQWFRSNKFILARGKIYLSKFHYLANLPTDDFSKNVSQVPDHEEFWREQDHFYVFEQQIQS